MFFFQILTYKDCHRTERNKIFIMAVDIQLKRKEQRAKHLWWFQIEKNTFGLHDLYKKNVSVVRIKIFLIA